MEFNSEGYLFISVGERGNISNAQTLSNQSGKILRLRGKGLHSLDRYGNGDILVHLNVWTPKKLSKDQKAFFESVKSHENFIPNPSISEKSFFEKVKDMFS